MADRQSHKRRWLRFSLATLLFASLCIGGLLSGYRSGYREGYRSGQQSYYDENLVTEVYSTTKFLWPDLSDEERAEQLDALSHLIRSTIASEIWDNPVLGAEIREFSTNQSLVITAPGSVHREIRGLFQQLGDRHDHQSVKKLRLVSKLQSLASQGKSQTSTFQFALPKSSQFANDWVEKHYEAGVDAVSGTWGNPAYKGECSDPRFPKWSLDQRIATWRRGDGLAYLALRNLDDGPWQLVAGWHREQ